MIPESVQIVATAAALLGAGLLALCAVKASSPASSSGSLAAPLLFGLVALAQSVLYLEFNDRYLVVLLPSALLLSLLAVGPVQGRGLALGGIALVALWSVWWERDYLARQGAVWQSGRLLVERGIPPERIDGGFEWNEWYRGRAAIAGAIEAASQGKPDENGRRLLRLVGTRLDASSARWAVAFAPPRDGSGSVLASVPYGNGHRVVAVQRF